MMHWKIIPSLVIILLLGSCKSDPQNPKQPKKITPPKVVNVCFDSDSAYRFVEEQVAFGPRVPGTQAHQKTLQYLKDKLAEYCDTAEVLSGNLTKSNNRVIPIYNVWGSI